MKISHISELKIVDSPEVFIYGISWKVRVSKDEDENALAVFLGCTKEDASSNWTAIAAATVKLMSLDDNKDAYEKSFPPYVFNPSNPCFGWPSFIQWDDLMKIENKYVKNDTIELKFEVTVEDPNYVDKSTLNFECVDKSCDCGSQATFKLSVTNIENLTAVRSPEFIMRGVPWDLTIYKHRKSALGVMLSNISSKEVECNAQMLVKLLTSKDDIDSIEKSVDGEVAKGFNIGIEDFFLWSEVLKPENGFVNNNSITLEVKLEASKPEGDGAPNTNPEDAKRRKFDCSICLEVIGSQKLSTTPCGHLFCTTCITAALQKRLVCPFCNKAVRLNSLRPLF